MLPRRLFFGNPRHARVKISPDGCQLAYLAEVNGVLNLWVASTSDPTSAVCVSTVRRDILDYFWLYTSQHLAFFSDRAGEEEMALRCVDVAGRSTTLLTPVRGAQARLSAVSPQRPNEIAIEINDRNPEYHDVCVVDVATGAMRRVCDNDSYSKIVVDSSLEPRLAIETNTDGSETWSIRDGDGNWMAFDHVSQEDVLGTRVIGLDEDGMHIYLLDSRVGNTTAVVQVDPVHRRRLTLAHDTTSDVEAVKLNPLSKRPEAVAFNRYRRDWLAIVPDVASDFAQLTDRYFGDFDIGSATLDNKTWIVEVNSDHKPKTYELYNRMSKSVKHLFASRPGLRDEELTRTSPALITTRDGLELVSYVNRKRDTSGRSGQPLGTIFLVHGGPWERHKFSYDAQRQWLADRGYTVVSVNFRGSTGFGKSFLNAGNFEWGGRMIDDLVDAAHWAIGEGLADPARIGLMGMSYGGYAGLMALSRPETPFACCVSLAAPPDLLDLLASLPEHWKHQITLFTKRVGDPSTPDGRALLRRHSPMTHVDEFCKPILLAHGVRDIRVNVDSVRRFAAALKQRDCPVTLLEYTDEGHGLVGQDNRLSYMAIVEAFFAKHLGGNREPFGLEIGAASLVVPIGVEHISNLDSVLSA